MGEGGTGEQAGADNPCRALVPVPARDGRDEPARRLSGGRPIAGFLAQLIADTDPTLRTTRTERTRTAAALYARTAGIPGRQSA